MKILFLVFFIVQVVFGSEFTHSVSYQGFTGVINTPNASVINEGDFTFHFDNQFDNCLRGYDHNKIHNGEQNYIFGTGIFPYVEIQGRLSEAKGYHRDLSANIKFELPFKYKYLPNIAVGYQDIGSAVNFYGNKYIVMDKEFWFVKASLGYGHSDVVPVSFSAINEKRMDGLFGALAVKTFDWLYLLAENDSREKFAGARVHMPKNWSKSFKLDALITTNLTDKYNNSIGINLTFPLYENTQSYEHRETIEKNINNVKRVQDVKEEKTDLNISISLPKYKAEEKLLNIQRVKTKIKNLGIENITIATNGDTIYVAYENGVFLMNDLDAMGSVLGILNKTKYKKFVLEQMRSKTVVVTIRGNLEKAREFYETPNIVTKESFTNTLEKVSPIDLSEYKMIVEKANDSSFRPKIEFAPVVKTFIGNEFGLFNYMLWLRTKAVINLYEGINISAVGDIHIANSEIDNHDYDWFMKLYERNSHMESVMLHMSNNIFSGVNTLSAGAFEENFSGVMDQYIFNISNHTFKIKMGYFEQYKSGEKYKEDFFGKIGRRQVYLAKYSYLLENYDTLAEINFGRYWNQDVGFDVKLKRYFGDVAISVFVSQSKPFFKKAILSEETDKFAGMSIEVPLTLRHTPLFKYGQIKGTSSFDYKVQTTIAREDGVNTIVTGSNYDPEMPISSEEYFYNRNRLQKSYIQRHAFRLVESYEKYVK